MAHQAGETRSDRARDPDADGLARRIIVATQAGLPLVADPWGAVAATLGVPAATVLDAVADMLARGVIRRIGAVPNHYAIGFTANGMSVWDIDDAAADGVGRFLAGLASVTHCYRRPRRPPQWPYNLFAMVHGRSRQAVDDEIAALAQALEIRFPGACRSRDVLYSSRILKKTGLRISA
nr:Lrp/AsnC family transcriptional regulator [Zoogloeaceae bacterium]